MAESALRLLGVAPSGPGLRTALRTMVKPGVTVVTALDDQRLAIIRDLLFQENPADIEPFIELAGRFLHLLEEPAPLVMSPAQQLAVMEELAPERPPDDPLAASLKHPGTQRLTVERLSELRSWGLDSAQLREAADQCQEPFAAKLRSLADLDQSLRLTGEEFGREFSAERLRRAVEGSLKQCPIRHIVCLAGAVEDPSREQVLAWAAEQGVRVDIIADWRSDGRLYETTRRLSERLGVPVAAFEDAGRWSDALFTDQVAVEHPGLKFVASPDSLAEVEDAIRFCLRRQSEHGELPEEQLLFARRAEEYAPLVKAAARRLGVGVHVGQSEPLLTNRFARCVLDVLLALSGDDVRRLLRPASTTYFGLGTKERESLWHALSESCRHADQWEKLADWSRESEVAWLTHLLEWRADARQERRPLGDWINRLRLFVAETRMIECAMDDAETATRDQYAGTAMQSSLADRLIAPSEPLGLAAFAKLCERVWTDATVYVSTDPNGIRFRSSTAALGDYKTVCLLGMLEGSLPRRRREDPLLNDAERRALRGATDGKVDLPDSHLMAAEERAEFHRLCTAASRSLRLSFPASDEDRDTIPAFYMNELCRAVGQEFEPEQPRVRELAPAKEDCLTPSDLALRKALDGPRQHAKRIRLHSEEIRDSLRPDFDGDVTPDELQDAAACPLRATMIHRLHMRTPRQSSVMGRLRDPVSQAGLTMSPTQDLAEAELLEAMASEIERRYPELNPWEARMLKTASERVAREMSQQEMRARDLWEREADGAQVLELGKDGFPNAFPIGNGEKIIISGKAIWMVAAGLPRVLLYRTSDPQWRASDQEGAELPDGLLSAALYALALCGKFTRGPVGIEIATLSGERRLYTVSSLERLRVLADVSHGIERREISASRKEFADLVKAELRKAAQRLKAMTALPISGPQCARCGYGEICRASQEFGEQELWENGE